MSLFKDKVLLITGGTGSFGNAVLNRFLKTDIGEIKGHPKQLSVYKRNLNSLNRLNFWTQNRGEGRWDQGFQPVANFAYRRRSIGEVSA